MLKKTTYDSFCNDGLHIPFSSLLSAEEVP